MDVFYIADPTDPTYTTVLVDFLGAEAGHGVNGFTVLDGQVDFGTVAPDTLLSGVTSVDVQADLYYAPETTLRFNMLALNYTSIENLRTDILALATALNDGGVIVWQPTGQTNPLYLDFFSSPIPNLLRGQDRAMFKIIKLLQDPDGLPLEIRTHIWFRGADSVIANAVGLDDGVGNFILPLTNPGNAPSELKIELEFPDSAARVGQVMVGRRSSGDLTDFAGLYSFSPAAITTNMETYYKKIWRQTITPTTVEGLLGAFRVIAAIQLSGSGLYTFMLRWGTADTDPLGSTCDEVFLDSSDFAAMSNPADVDLGLVSFDRDGSELVLELWGKSDSATDIAIGDAFLLPADEQLAVVSAPGFRHGFFNKTVWLGSELTKSSSTTISDQENDAVVIDVLNDYVETESQVLPAGVHIVQFLGHARNPDGAKTQVGRLQVLAGSEVDHAYLTVPKNRVLAGYEDNPRRCIFVADGTTSYKFRVQQTAATTAGRHIRLHKLRRWFIPTAGGGRKFIIDGIAKQSWVASALNARWWPLECDGPLPFAPGGNFVLVLRSQDVAQAGVFLDADARGPLGKPVAARIMNATVTVRPRYTH